MRQAFQAAAALTAVALLAAGCAKPSSSSANGTGAGAAVKFTGCMVTDTGGINDKSFNQSSWQGMQAAAAADKNISTFESQKCGIIVTVGFLMGPATQSAALANSKQKFAIVDFS